MKKNILFILVHVTGIATAQPAFEWAQYIGGNSWNRGTSIAVDAAGNIYTTGNFAGTQDFDPGPGVVQLISTGSSCDLFISKTDPSGNLIWVKSIGGTIYNSAYSLAVDVSGNCYLAGVFIHNVDFDPGPGTYFIDSPGLNNYSAFVLKLDPNGNFRWAASFIGPWYDWATSITLDASGNLYTVGTFAGTVDFDPGPGVFNLSSSAYMGFICKLDTAGNFDWVKQLPTGWWGVASCTTDPQDNIIAVGRFTGTVDFDPGPAIYNLTSEGLFDGYSVKLDVNGDFIWAMQAGGAGNDIANDVLCDHHGKIYVTGSFEDSIHFHPALAYATPSNGGTDAYIWKMNGTGSFIGAKCFGGKGNDAGKALSSDYSGRLYCAGNFSDTVDFDPGQGISNLISYGQSDIFISRFDGSGNFLCAAGMGGKGLDLAEGIVTNQQGDIYTTGSFTDTADFDPGPGSFLFSSQSSNIFISKLGECSSLTGSEELPGLSDRLRIYPNPSAGIFSVGSGTGSAPVFLRIVNMLGEEVFSTKTALKEEQLIDLSQEKKGFYFIYAEQEGRRRYAGIVIQ